jgi:hypothetical protein
MKVPMWTKRKSTPTWLWITFKNQLPFHPVLAFVLSQKSYINYVEL